MDKEFYIYLSSRDSIKTFTTNTASDFSVLLPDRLQFNSAEKWRCGLVELIIPDTPSEPCFLCSNFCQSSIVGEHRLPALRRIVDVQSDPNHVTYVPIRCSELDIIRLYISTYDGQRPSLPSGITYCTLHFVHNHESSTSNR